MKLLMSVMGSYRIKQIIFFFLWFNSSAQKEDELISNFLNEKTIELEETWNDKGYWGDALKKKDNRYNEAITFYLFMEDVGFQFYEERIQKAIEFSFKNLQHKNGAILQENQPSHIRTSLFLHGIAKTSVKYPEILEKDIVKNGINQACNWLRKPHNFATNHNISAMLAMFSLYHSTCNVFYFDLFKFYRDNIIESYISIDKKRGFWPEAPWSWRNWSWKNRLNVPYLLVQSFLLQEYLLMNDDNEIKILSDKLNNFIFSKMDINQCKIDVRNSIGNFKEKKVKDLKVSVASFFWIDNIKKKITKEQRRKALIKCTNFFNDEIKRAPVLLNTDSYYRFGLIKKL